MEQADLIYLDAAVRTSSMYVLCQYRLWKIKPFEGTFCKHSYVDVIRMLCYVWSFMIKYYGTSLHTKSKVEI